MHNVLTCLDGCWLGYLAYSVASGLGHTSKGLPKATIGCEVLLRGHSGRRAGFGTIELSAIGKPHLHIAFFFADNSL